MQRGRTRRIAAAAKFHFAAMSICSGKKLAKFEVRHPTGYFYSGRKASRGGVSDRRLIREVQTSLCLSQLRVCSLCQSDKSDLLNSAICLRRGAASRVSPQRRARPSCPGHGAGGGGGRIPDAYIDRQTTEDGLAAAASAAVASAGK